MPRSFLVKKYLKQKYDADFKLQQSLNNNNITNNDSNPTSDNLDNQSDNQISLKSNDCTTNSTATDSGKAAVPFTPSLAQPLAVRLSKGYILDMSNPNSVHNGGDAESSNIIARTPKHEHESAARENQQPRRSVIVTNSNHPANRNVHPQKNDDIDINNSNNSNNVHVSTYARRYASSPSTFSYKGQASYSNSQTLLDRPSMAHMPSPPPAHTPVPSSPLPTHISAPTPAHTSIVSHSLNLSQTPTPTLISSGAYVFTSQSPSPAHLNPSRISPRPEMLPADHPINHPLIQHLINQRLHVPEDNTALSHNKNIQDTHEPMEHQVMRTSYSPPHDKDDVYMRPENNEDHLRRVHYTVIPQGNESSEFEHRTNEGDSSRLAVENSSQSMSSTINQNHFPPSPSPSLPSSSPTLPGLTSLFSHTSSPPSPVPSFPPPSPHSSTETNAYTYEAFLVSDGRSRKRALAEEVETNSTGRVRYTCSDCGKDYATSSNLSRHKQTHRSLDSKNAKKCPHCDKVYVSMPALSMHVLTHDLKHSCKVCGKTFSRPWLLQGHMRSHTGEKPFGCAHCGKAFADRSNLRAHMQTHSAFKHFACDKCNKTFALKSYLNKHLESACVKE